MLQIVFNEVSAAEISRLDTLTQLDLLAAFQVDEKDLEQLDGDRFGKLEREGFTLYRYRAGEHRIYFEISSIEGSEDPGVLVRRVLHKNTFQDFLYRSALPTSEDEQLAGSKSFWKLIDESNPSAAS